MSHGGLETKLTIIPEAFSDTCLVTKENLPIDKLPTFATAFNFLLFGQITGNNSYNDRKNTFFTLKWLFEEFKDQEDVGIVLKTNSGRNSLIDKNHTVQIVKQVINEARKGAFPRVHLLHGEMSDLEVAALYQHPQIKALVALTRGEGYGLPILEAAASGLPVIATGWSGHMDFLKHGKFVSIYYQLGEIHQSRVDGKIFMPGARWANPSEQDFKKRVAKFHSSPATPKEWALELSDKLKKMYCFEKISQHYSETFKEIL
jgi:glycosyltransferase involved in cell wall biosynthesis